MLSTGTCKRYRKPLLATAAPAMQQKIKNARDAYIDCVKMNTCEKKGAGKRPKEDIHR